MAQKIKRVQVTENVARYYTYQGSNMGTTSTSYVDFTPSVSITTIGGALEMELFCTAYVSANTGYFALQVNGVDYEMITVSGSTERGFWGKIRTPALPAGTYTIKMRGKGGGGASINVPAFISQTIYVKEVAA